MLAENQVGCCGVNVFLGNHRPASRAKPTLYFRAFVTAKGVIREVIRPCRCSPPIPSCPLGFGFDVEFIVMRHLLAGLSQESVAHLARIPGFACQHVAKRILSQRVVLFRFGFHAVQQPRGPRVIAHLKLDLINLGRIQEEIGMSDGDAFLFGLSRRRGRAERREGKQRDAPNGRPMPSFPLHHTRQVRHLK